MSVFAQNGVDSIYSRPEIQQEGNSDSYTITYNTYIFVLEKILVPPTRKKRRIDNFLRLAEIASNILTQIERDTDDWRLLIVARGYYFCSTQKRVWDMEMFF